MRRRPAPSAARKAISRNLPLARISNRFATLAQAISRTRPTAASSTNRGRRTFSVTSTRKGTTAALQSLSIAGRSAESCLATAARSCCACRRLTPGLSRAMVESQRPPLRASARSMAKGT
jgi:hypothetical protein